MSLFRTECARATMVCEVEQILAHESAVAEGVFLDLVRQKLG